MNKIRCASAWSVILLLAGTAFVFAHPNRWAQTGGLDVFSAATVEQGLLSVNGLHLGAGYTDHPYGHNYTGLGFAPFSFLELSATLYAEGYRLDDDRYLLGPIMLAPVLKSGYSFIKKEESRFFFAPGGVLKGYFPSGNFWVGDSTAVPDPLPGADVLVVASLGYDMFQFHLNAGYGMSFASDGISSSVPWGVFIEISPAEILDVGIEASNRHPVDDISSFDALVVAPLVRLNIPAPVTFDLAAPLALGDTLYPWKVELGVSAAFDLIRTPRLPAGYLTGRVIDAQTAEPIAARLVFPEKGIDPILTDSLTGEYSLELAPDVYRIRAESEGYKWKEKGVVLQDDEKRVLDFSLVRLTESRAFISGTVKDADSGLPLEGVEVSFADTLISTVFTDVLGIFKLNIPPGTRHISFAKNGYATQIQSVIVQNGESKELNISLASPAAQEPTQDVSEPTEPVKPSAPEEWEEPRQPTSLPDFKNILFAPGSATIISSSFAAVDEVVEYLKENPGIHMEIAGHTDSIGDEESNLRISQERADALKKYMVEQGIDSSRLDARGYGETRPIGDNRTRRGQKANRRIEFVIISE